MNKNVIIFIFIIVFSLGATTKGSSIYLNNELSEPIDVKINCLLKKFTVIVPAATKLETTDNDTLTKPGFIKVDKKKWRFDSIEYRVINKEKNNPWIKTKRTTGSGFGDWNIIITQDGVIME